jgi:hypothetical protein
MILSGHSVEVPGIGIGLINLQEGQKIEFRYRVDAEDCQAVIGKMEIIVPPNNVTYPMA